MTVGVSLGLEEQGDPLGYGGHGKGQESSAWGWQGGAAPLGCCWGPRAPEWGQLDGTGSIPSPSRGYGKGGFKGITSHSVSPQRGAVSHISSLSPPKAVPSLPLPPKVLPAQGSQAAPPGHQRARLHLLLAVRRAGRPPGTTYGLGPCPAFSWDRVNFPPRSWRSMFWIWGENNVDNTRML